jgi:hypothetical protein
MPLCSGIIVGGGLAVAELVLYRWAPGILGRLAFLPAGAGCMKGAHATPGTAPILFDGGSLVLSPNRRRAIVVVSQGRAQRPNADIGRIDLRREGDRGVMRAYAYPMIALPTLATMLTYLEQAVATGRLTAVLPAVLPLAMLLSVVVLRSVLDLRTVLGRAMRALADAHGARQAG